MGAKRSWLDRVFRGDAVPETEYGAQELEQEEPQSDALDGTYARVPQSINPRRDKLVEFSRAKAGVSAETAAYSRETASRDIGGFNNRDTASFARETGGASSREAGGFGRDTGGFTKEFKDGATNGGGFSGSGFTKSMGADSADAYVVFKRLKDFTMASQVADRMTENKIVILNLESCDDEIARRVLDFIGGVAYACGSMVKRIAGRVFMITPKGVNSDGEFFDEVKGTAAVIRYDD